MCMCTCRRFGSSCHGSEAALAMPGFRQRLQWSKASDTSRSPRRPGGIVIEAWLSEWAWGKCAAVDLVRRAHAHVGDHGARGLDERLLRLARTFTNMANAERVVESILPLEGVCDPSEIPASLIQWILPPYAFFHWLRTTSMHSFCLYNYK